MMIIHAVLIGTIFWFTIVISSTVYGVQVWRLLKCNSDLNKLVALNLAM